METLSSTLGGELERAEKSSNSKQLHAQHAQQLCVVLGGDAGAHFQLRLERRERPSALSPTRVRVRPAFVGICGTDLEAVRCQDQQDASRWGGQTGQDQSAAAPAGPAKTGGQQYARGVVLGHEFSAVVEEVGAEVAGWKRGDAAAVEPIQPCGEFECAECRSGRVNICARMRVHGIDLDGGMASQASLPARALHRLPPGLDLQLAALAEPAAVCVRAARVAGAAPGVSLAVYGAGPIGLLALLASRALGASSLAAREAAKAAGASPVVAPEEAAGLASRFDSVLVCANDRLASLDAPASLCRPAGTLVLVGILAPSLSFTAYPALSKELTIRHSVAYAGPPEPPLRVPGRALEELGDFEAGLEVLRRAGPRARALISHAFPLERAPDAFAVAANRPACRSAKVLIKVAGSGPLPAPAPAPEPEGDASPLPVDLGAGGGPASPES
eukprot:tig00000553_g2120.t1